MKEFSELVEIVTRLRGPNGCPWDKAQTHESLTPYAIEEAHELEEAILRDDTENLKEELGDLLFQSVLHAEVARQDGTFDIQDVLKKLNHKMIHRHPHVFADTKADSAEEVVTNWEEIKSQEKPEQELFDIPKSFPALLKSQKIGKRTRKMDFDWETQEQVLNKVHEEFNELQEALQQKDRNSIQEEFGDLLFTLAQLARHLDMDAEKALRLSNDKFIRRFNKMLEHQPEFTSLSREEKEALWHQVKIQLKKDS